LANQPIQPSLFETELYATRSRF